MNKEGDGSLDRFTNYQYAPSVPAIVDTSLERTNMAFTYNTTMTSNLQNSSLDKFPKRSLQTSLPPGLNYPVNQ